MAHYVTDRIVAGLQRSAAILGGLAALVVIGGIGWTTTADALQTAVVIAVLAFGLPAVALFALSYWLERQAASLEGKQLLAASHDEAARHPFRDYAVAVLAALSAWGVRALIDPVLPGSIPFITYFIAVAVSGWVGGYGPAVLATAISACVARYFYMDPPFSFQLMTPTDAVRLGSFVFVCLAIGGLTAALHAALRRVQTLANELRALQAGQMATAPDMSQSADMSQSVDLEADEVIPPLQSE